MNISASKNIRHRNDGILVMQLRLGEAGSWICSQEK
jgi:hypothetical protein